MGGFESFIVVADDRAYSSFSQFYSFTAVSQFSISLPLLGLTVLRCVSFHSHENSVFVVIVDLTIPFTIPLVANQIFVKDNRITRKLIRLERKILKI